MSENIRLGPCSVTFGSLEIERTQGGVELTIEPLLKAIKVDQFGQSDYDDRIVGWNVRVKVPLLETDYDTIKGALVYLGEIGTTQTKLADRALGTSMRELADVLTIHPLENAADNLADDVTLYLAAPVNQVTLGYNFENERVLEVEFKAYPKEDADPTEPDAFFCIGNPAAA